MDWKLIQPQSEFKKIQDYSAMMSGNQKGIPLKVPTIPIKVLSPNTTQVCLL